MVMLNIDQLKYYSLQPFLEYIKSNPGSFGDLGDDGYMTYFLDDGRKNIFYYSPSEKRLCLFMEFWYELFNLYGDNEYHPWTYSINQGFVKFLFKKTFDFKINSVE